MNNDVQDDILRRLNAIERSMARVRVGEVTGTGPADVALGGADTSYEEVKSLGPMVSGDQVATLVWGNDLIALGRVGDGARQIVEVHYTLFGPEPREASGLQQALAQTTYAFPGSALSASTDELYAGMSVRAVRYAVWRVVWTPNATGCGIELITFDPGPSNIVQVAERTGNASISPVNDSALVTTAMQDVVDFVGGGALGDTNFHKQIGHRLKSDGSVSPRIYLSKVKMLLEVE